MFNQLLAALFILNAISFNVVAAQNNNPFAKSESLIIGTDVGWEIDKEAVIATKTVRDEKGIYYHLQFDNKQLKLMLTKDATGLQPKAFTQLEVKNLEIDGKQNPLFKWCLLNQQRHSRFLQQGLVVKKNICYIDGDAGSFVMRLNSETLTSLLQANRLFIRLKPFRTGVNLDYDISDFKAMALALNAKPEPEPEPEPEPVILVAKSAVTEAVVTEQVIVEPVMPVVEVIDERCLAEAPEKYRNIAAVEYDCADVEAKNQAEASIEALVDEATSREKKRLAERERQRKLAEEKKQKALAEKLKQEQLLQAEAAAIAASEAKQAQISNEITQKMLNVCKKYWAKNEHRCYCQKYIEHAPASIRSSASCD